MKNIPIHPDHSRRQSTPFVTHCDYFRSKLNHHQNNQGHTLVELLVYIGILSFVLLIVTQLFGTIVSNQLIIQPYNKLDQDARYITTRLGYDIRRATDLTLNQQQLTITTDTPLTYSFSGNTATLTDSSGTHELHTSQTQIQLLSIQLIDNPENTQTLNLHLRLTNQDKQHDINTSFTTRL